MKKLLVIVLAALIAVSLCACEFEEITQTVSGNRVTGGADIQRFDYAYIYLGDTVIAEGKVVQWRDYNNSDTVQIVIGDKYYLTHYTNVVMISDRDNRLGWDHD